MSIRDLILTVDAWLVQGQAVALATVVETWGSSPRQSGAKMASNATPEMVGSVSGGCVESAVISEASDGLIDQHPRWLHYGVSDDSAWEVGLACGGKLSVFVEPLDGAWWVAVKAAVGANRSVVTALVLDGPHAGAKVFLEQQEQTSTASMPTIRYASATLTPTARGALIEAATVALHSGQNRVLELAGQHILLDVICPQPKLILIGGAHVAQALASFAVQAEFRVFVIDPRQAFATPTRFPNVEQILTTYPDRALAALGLDEQTYIAILTHDPKIDDPALLTALPAGVPYIGILSSRRSHEQRIARLTAAGVDPALFAQIHVPIGLKIGAKTPVEIALCILAQIIGVRNGAMKRQIASAIPHAES